MWSTRSVFRSALCGVANEAASVLFVKKSFTNTIVSFYSSCSFIRIKALVTHEGHEDDTTASRIFLNLELNTIDVALLGPKLSFTADWYLGRITLSKCFRLHECPHVNATTGLGTTTRGVIVPHNAISCKNAHNVHNRPDLDIAKRLLPPQTWQDRRAHQATLWLAHC